MTRWTSAGSRLAGVKRLPQPADLPLEGTGGMDGQVRSPQVIDKLAGRHWSPRVYQQDRQQSTDL